MSKQTTTTIATFSNSLIDAQHPQHSDGRFSFPSWIFRTTSPSESKYAKPVQSVTLNAEKRHDVDTDLRRKFFETTSQYTSSRL